MWNHVILPICTSLYLSIYLTINLFFRPSTQLYACIWARVCVYVCERVWLCICAHRFTCLSTVMNIVFYIWETAFAEDINK